MKLNLLGLTGYELNVYRSLLIVGTVSAKELSLVCDVPLTAIYPNLSLLESKGLLKKYTGDITRFQAIKPSLALNNLVQKNTALMEKAKDDLVNELKSLPVSLPHQKNPIELSMGTQASISTHQDFVKNSKKSLHVMGWRFSSTRSIYPLIHSLFTAQEKGLDIKIIVIADNARTQLLANECKKLSIPLRYLDMNNFSIIISDEKECKLTLKNKSLRERVNLHITDIDLVKGLADYFLTLWSRAKDL